jgi:hypothetical protein
VKKLTFYEQVGIVIPGSVLLFGLLFFFPSLKDLLAKDGVSVGQLGIFVLLSYAAGHLIAAVGNVLENILWRPFGGLPSDWVVKEKTNLLSDEQLFSAVTKEAASSTRHHDSFGHRNGS